MRSVCAWLPGRMGRDQSRFHWHRHALLPPIYESARWLPGRRMGTVEGSEEARGVKREKADISVRSVVLEADGLTIENKIGLRKAGPG